MYLASTVVGGGDAEPTQVVIDASNHAIVQVQAERGIAPPFGGDTIYAFDAGDSQVWSTTLANDTGDEPEGRNLIGSSSVGVLSSFLNDDGAATATLEVAALDASGDATTTEIAVQNSGPGPTGFVAGASSPDGTFAFVGVTPAQLDFGTGPLTPQGHMDVFVVVFEPLH